MMAIHTTTELVLLVPMVMLVLLALRVLLVLLVLMVLLAPRVPMGLALQDRLPDEGPVELVSIWQAWCRPSEEKAVLQLQWPWAWQGSWLETSASFHLAKF